GSFGTLVADGSLNISGQLVEGADGIDSATLSGTGDVTIAGLFTWKHGIMAGAGKTFANGGINIVTSGGGVVLKDLRQLDIGRLDNPVTVTWTSGDITFQNGAVFNNNATFDVQGNNSISLGSGADSAFNN